jgi:hypothetical protein
MDLYLPFFQVSEASELTRSYPDQNNKVSLSSDKSDGMNGLQHHIYIPDYVIHTQILYLRLLTCQASSMK